MFINLLSGFLQVSNESTYQEVVRATCGKVTGVLCELAIAVYTFGTCIAFFIVIGDQLDRCKYRQNRRLGYSWLRFSVLGHRLLKCFGIWLSSNIENVDC